MAQIAGKYVLESSENFDAFLSEIGVGFILRNLAKTSKPEVFIEVHENGTYVIKSVTIIKTFTIEFKLGEEFMEARPDGKSVKTVVNMEGDNKLVQIQYGDKQVKIERIFTEQGMKAVFTVNKVVSSRFFKRLA